MHSGYDGVSWKRILVMLFLFPVLLTPRGLSAQEMDVDTTAVPSPPTSEQREDFKARETIAKLDSLWESIEELKERRGSIEGEERTILIIDARENVEAMDELFSDLTKTLPRMDTTSTVIDSVQHAALERAFALSEFYSLSLQSLGERLDGMIVQRSQLTATELGDFETRVTQERELQDHVIELAVSTAYRIEALGGDPTSIWEDLDLLILGRAESLTGRLQVSVLERDRITKQIKAAEKASTSEKEIAILRARLQATDQRVEGIAASLGEMTKIMDRRGLASTDYKEILILTTGEVTEDLLDPEVLLRIVKNILEASIRWLRDNGLTVLTWVGIVAAFTILFRVAAIVGWRVLRLVIRPPKLLGNMIGRFVRPLGSLVGLLAGLWFLGVDPTTLLTGVGVVSVIVGLALQDSLSNLAAGIFILIYRPYDVDDIVTVGGVLGKVREMGFANTTIVTFDNRRLFVPNRKIWSEVIENRSAEAIRRVEVLTRISFREDIENAIEVIRRVIAEHTMVLDEPEPSVFVSNLADSWVEIAVWPWGKTEDWWTLTTELPKVLRIGLERAGIEIPYPRHEVDLACHEERGEENQTADG